MTEKNGVRINELNKISEKLDAIIKTRGGVSGASFWTGLIVSCLVILAAIGGVFADYSKLKTNFQNHIANKEIHFTMVQKKNIILNTQHRLEYTHFTLNQSFATVSELESLKSRVKTTERKIEELQKK